MYQWTQKLYYDIDNPKEPKLVYSAKYGIKLAIMKNKMDDTVCNFTDVRKLYALSEYEFLINDFEERTGKKV